MSFFSVPSSIAGSHPFTFAIQRAFRMSGRGTTRLLLGSGQGPRNEADEPAPPKPAPDSCAGQDREDARWPIETGTSAGADFHC